MEEADEEVTVEVVKSVGTLFVSHAGETIPKIVRVAIEEALALYEVDEHKAVQHQGRVPLAIALTVYPLDEGQEGCVLGLETIVEPLGYVIDIEGSLGPARDGSDVES